MSKRSSKINWILLTTLTLTVANNIDIDSSAYKIQNKDSKKIVLISFLFLFLVKIKGFK